MDEELKQSKIVLEKGEDLKTQIAIIQAWEDWYIKAIESTKDMVDSILTIEQDIDNSQKSIKKRATEIITDLSN